jgi:hypothetical protein
MWHGKVNHAVQAKLTVNTPGDVYEQEADAMADRVMRMSSNETAKPVTGLIGKSLQRKCAHCEEEEKRSKPVMRKADAGNAGMFVSSSFASSLNASKGGGASLPQGTRNFMENAFSTDFSAVKIHTDSQAAEMSKDINAKAFTYGNDIYFREGQYNSDSWKGRHLLAHELTHTIQQKSGDGKNNKIQKSPEDNALGCLIGLVRSPEMSQQTYLYLERGCNDHNSRISQTGIEFISEDHADAFGHCWIGCEGTKRCGFVTTAIMGGLHEMFRDVQDIVGYAEHNSYDEDLFNQAFGEIIANDNPDVNCFNSCYQATAENILHFHGYNSARTPGNSRVYNCSDITVDGNFYGGPHYRIIPNEYLERY